MLPVMSSLPVLLLFFVQCINSEESDAFFLLSGNDPKRVSQCSGSQNGEHTCRYQCLQGKCSNEEIVVAAQNQVHLECNKAQAACLGHIMLRGRSEREYARKATLDCDYMTVGSCHGSLIKFSDVVVQTLNGDVRESDILFQDADLAMINLLDPTPKDLETVFRHPRGTPLKGNFVAQFSMNEVYTRKVKKFELNAMVDYSAVGSVFDLTGISDTFTIKCRGRAACDGSLFIVDRCVKDDWTPATIYCWPGACNAISVWVLHDAQNSKKNKGANICSQGTKQKKKIATFVTLKAWNDELEKSGKSSKKPASGAMKRNLFLFADLGHTEQFMKGLSNDPILGALGGLDTKKPMTHSIDMDASFKAAFNVIVSKDRVSWMHDIQTRVAHGLNGVGERNIKHGWAATNEGMSFLGATYANSLLWRLSWGVQTQAINWVDYIAHGTSLGVALSHAATPLLPIAIAAGAWNIGYRLYMKPKQERLQMPQSRLAQALPAASPPQRRGSKKSQAPPAKSATPDKRRRGSAGDLTSLKAASPKVVTRRKIFNVKAAAAVGPGLEIESQYTMSPSSELWTTWSVYALMAAMLIACVCVALVGGCVFGVCGALIARKMHEKDTDRNLSGDDAV